MMYNEMIKGFHDNDDLFMKIVELGCGATLMNRLCQVPGASNTVYGGSAPNDKKCITDLYTLDEGTRFVSEETIISILEATDLINAVTTVYASTFQVGHYNDVSTHGFIGIKTFGSNIIFHVSIHDSLSRAEYMEKIAEIGITILYRYFTGPISLDNVDCVYNLDINYNKTPKVLYNTLNFIDRNKNSFIAFSIEKDTGTLQRLEHVLRLPSQGIIIYKGSFNPLHEGHLLLMKEAQKLYSDYNFFFSISLNTYGKRSNTEELYNRLKALSDYNVIVTNEPSFEKLAKIIRGKSDKEVVFPMGYDTWERVLSDESLAGIIDIPATFVVMNRNGFSVDSEITEKYPNKIITITNQCDLSSSMIRKDDALALIEV